MKITNRLSGCLVAAALLLGAGLLVADTPGRHPLYLHARTDLRAAQAMLRVHEEPNVDRHQVRAYNAVERAVHEIDQASVLDGKNLVDHPPIDTSLDRVGRFRKIMELLGNARRDLGREEDNPASRDWRNRAYRNIDEAIESVKLAARELHIDRNLGF